MKPPKTKKCKQCGSEFNPFKSTERVCSLQCALAGAKVVVRGQNKAAVDKVMNELKAKTTDWRGKLQTKLQEVARLIDHGQTCLAKGNHPKQLHGGHIWGKGSHSNIALNLHNIHRQSAQSNHFQSDDRLMHQGVIREYGQEYYDKLQSLLGFKMPKFTNEEWMEMYRTACSISNDLKRNLQVNDTKTRVELREKFNKMIGIYGE